MGHLLSLTMNDAAADLLGVLNGLADIEPPGGLAPGLRERTAQGIVRREKVLTWASSVGGAAGAPSFFNDLTAWECADSSFHLEDVVPVDVLTVDNAPVISEDDQRILLLQASRSPWSSADWSTLSTRPAPCAASWASTRPTRPSGSTRSDLANPGTPPTSTPIVSTR